MEYIVRASERSIREDKVSFGSFPKRGAGETEKEESDKSQNSLLSPGLQCFKLCSPSLPAHAVLAARYSNTKNKAHSYLQNLSNI